MTKALRLLNVALYEGVFPKAALTLFNRTRLCGQFTQSGGDTHYVDSDGNRLILRTGGSTMRWEWIAADGTSKRFPP